MRGGGSSGGSTIRIRAGRFWRASKFEPFASSPPPSETPDSHILPRAFRLPSYSTATPALVHRTSRQTTGRGASRLGTSFTSPPPASKPGRDAQTAGAVSLCPCLKILSSRRASTPTSPRARRHLAHGATRSRRGFCAVTREVRQTPPPAGPRRPFAAPTRMPTFSVFVPKGLYIHTSRV
jgi:hypothetical protein